MECVISWRRRRLNREATRYLRPSRRQRAKTRYGLSVDAPHLTEPSAAVLITAVLISCHTETRIVIDWKPAPASGREERKGSAMSCISHHQSCNHSVCCRHQPSRRSCKDMKTRQASTIISGRCVSR